MFPLIQSTTKTIIIHCNYWQTFWNAYFRVIYEKNVLLYGHLKSRPVFRLFSQMVNSNIYCKAKTSCNLNNSFGKIYSFTSLKLHRMIVNCMSIICGAFKLFLTLSTKNSFTHSFCDLKTDLWRNGHCKRFRALHVQNHIIYIYQLKWLELNECRWGDFSS